MKSLSISLIVIFLYGGMLQGLFPTNDRISWESHLLGALAGAFCAFFYRDVQLQAAERRKARAMAAVESIDSQHPSIFTSNGSSTFADMQEAADTYPLQAGFFPMPEPVKKIKPVAPPAEGTGNTTFVYEWKTTPKRTKTYLFKASQSDPGWEQSYTKDAS